MKLSFLLCLLLLTAAVNCLSGDAKGPTTVTVRISGLCYPERVDDLREFLKDHQKVKVESVNFERGEVTFTFANLREFSVESLRHTIGVKGFGVKDELKIPWDKLSRIDINVVALDCKGCALGLHNTVMRVDGVERATADVKEGKLTVLIDPAKTNRAAVEEALKRAHVKLKESEK